MARPAVDVVVPFAGPPPDLQRLAALRLGEGDSLVVVDNNRRPAPPAGGVTVIHRPDRATPGYARNRGAEQGHADWLLFLDADVVPPADLLDRYFDPAPGERAALVAGEMEDEPVPPDAPAVARYAHLRGLMTQEDSFALGSWGFPKTANALCRRAAFEEIGGFTEDIRAGEDADLTYRLKAAGWQVERRERAAVTHRSRQTVTGFVAQKALHGAGGAWLARRYPGAFPARRRPGLVWWGVRTVASGVVRAARERDRDTAVYAVFEPLELLSFEFGRSLPNERPAPGRWARLLG
ncbi:MAG TPA: glycosyltransferase [Thermoleophilaceae bacterium]